MSHNSKGGSNVGLAKAKPYLFPKSLANAYLGPFLMCGCVRTALNPFNHNLPVAAFAAGNSHAVA